MIGIEKSPVRSGIFGILKSNYTTDALVKNVRLHHYQTRSQQECQRKIDDVTAPWHLEQKMSSWRKDIRGGGGCSLGLYCDIHDFTLSCLSDVVAEAMGKMFL